MKDAHQRKAYALRRMSAAVDRQLLAGDTDDKARAARWALLWAVRAGVRKRGELWQNNSR